MKIQIGIAEAHRQSVVDELVKLLADENILYVKTKNAHWNIEGPDFYDKHKFFESQFIQLDAIIDSVAERIRSLGHYAPASLKSYLSLTHLTEAKSEKNDSEGFIKELLQDHQSIIISICEHVKCFGEEFHDLGTADFVTGLMQKHEKMAWFLRSHLKN
ncbi:DNA starvation/stationary phase protection protein [Chryseobacterium aahli]|uniref:Dps family protein n=1 Tax=Chryseobacterium aahli TaxID=1278643 RepID=UPI001F60B964|nr:DNA starvation/stationary phase protection protein [Chryseobacterium aahli]MCI3936300.1 DNA starvation/stationary phase protection protein [Chryseobacterium aahli]